MIWWVFLLITANGPVIGARETWDACERARQAQIVIHKAAEVTVTHTSACRPLAVEELEEIQTR